MIFITSKREGFARCGVRFSETTTSYPDDRFTPEQLADLEAEPMLIVSREGTGMTAGQAAEQISRLKDALDTAEHEVAVVTAERDALREQLAALTPTSAANAQDETAPGEDEDVADAEAKPDAEDAPKTTRAKKK
ncbi:hypothetical protein FNA12_15310 [Salmonella enterica]|nr:hypothetical protein [Salmonella enterica]